MVISKMQKILQFIKKEIVLCIALFLGFLGILVCRPDFATIKSSIDFRVLSLLFCLMYVIQGFSSINLLEAFVADLYVSETILPTLSNISI